MRGARRPRCLFALEARCSGAAVVCVVALLLIESIGALVGLVTLVALGVG